MLHSRSFCIFCAAVIKFCTQCAAPVIYDIPADDNRLRAICSECAYIHYENPRLVVGCIAEWEGRILLCRRDIEPRHGFWTLPAGFMENGETTAEAAMREALEESCADIAIDAPFAMVCISHISQIHLFYRGQLRDGRFAAGEETQEARLFSAAEIPWDDLAFRSVSFALERYLQDRQNGNFTFHTQDLAPL